MKLINNTLHLRDWLKRTDKGEQQNLYVQTNINYESIELHYLGTTYVSTVHYIGNSHSRWTVPLTLPFFVFTVATRVRPSFRGWSYRTLHNAHSNGVYLLAGLPGILLAVVYLLQCSISFSVVIARRIYVANAFRNPTGVVPLFGNEIFSYFLYVWFWRCRQSASDQKVPWNWGF